MQILLIRHGAAAGNLEKRYVGRTDEPLCGEGIRQLKECFSLPGNSYPIWGKEETLFVVSPMKRCVQTAEIFAEWMGIIKPEFIIEPDFREMDFGDFEYHNYEELKTHPAYLRYLETNGGSSFPNAEPLAQFKERCIQGFLRNIKMLESQDDAKAVFVVHGGTIMAVMERFAHPSQPYFSWQVKNGGGYLITAVCRRTDGGSEPALLVQKKYEGNI